MKKEWQVNRTVVERSDGQRRWDMAYQLLVRWAMEPTVEQQSTNTPCQEHEHEDSFVYPSIDPLPNAKSNH